MLMARENRRGKERDSWTNFIPDIMCCSIWRVVSSYFQYAAIVSISTCLHMATSHAGDLMVLGIGVKESMMENSSGHISKRE